MLFIITVLIPFLVVIQVVFVISKNKIVDQTTLLTIESADKTYFEINNLLKKYIEICKGYVYNIYIQEVLNTSYDTSLISYESYNYLDKIITSDIVAKNFQVEIKMYILNETFSQDYLRVFYASENIQSQQFYRSAIAHKNDIVWGYDQDGIFLAKSILHSGNTNLGVFRMNVKNDEIFSTIQEDNSYDRLTIVYDNEGYVLASNQFNLIGSSIKNENYFSLAKENPNSMFDYLDENRFKIISHSFTTETGMPEWQLLTFIPIGSILAEGNRVSNYGLIISLTCLLISFLIFIMMLQKITDRIKLLVDKIKVASEGKFEAVSDTGPMDEIGILINRFNNMSLSLEQMINENYKTKILLNEVTIKKHEAELFALQNQIHPHFLFNTLESIRMKMLLNNPHDAANMIISLSKILRKSLNWKGEIITLADEIDFVKNYLEIQKLRFNDKLHYIIDIEESHLVYKVPKLIIQPFVENSIKHGLEMKIGGGSVAISTIVVDEKLIIVIADDGIGIAPDRLDLILKETDGGYTPNKVSSIGIKNVNDRITLHYGIEYGISIKSETNQGTEIRIILPCQI